MKTKLLSLTFFLFFFIFGTQAQVELTACDTDFNGVEAFDLTTVIPALLGNENPENYSVTFHVSETNAIVNINPITNPTAFFLNTSNLQVIWIRFTNNLTQETNINSFSLQVNAVPNPGTPGTAVFCENSPANDLFNYLGGTPEAGGTWSPALASGTGVFDPTLDVEGVYTYSVNGTAPCPPQNTTVTVTINPSSNAGTNSSITLCETNSSIDLFTYLGNSADTSGSWSPTLASGTSIFDPSQDTSGTYTYTIIGTPPCVNSSASVTVTVNPIPSLGIEVAVACDDNNDGIATFDLSYAVEINYEANNPSPNTMLIEFYETLNDLQNQSNPLGYTYTNSTPNQIIYIRIDNLLTSCFWGSEFFLMVENCSTSCIEPFNLSATNIEETGAILSWTNQSQNSIGQEIIILTAGSPAPDQESQGFIPTFSPFAITALTCETSFTFYVRTICQDQSRTEWSEGLTFTTLACNSTVNPYVSVNTTTFTPEQILNNIILNSSCGIIDNVVTQGQCGVGYFNGNDSDFPFQEGLVIRSGQANLSEGPFVNQNSSLSSTCSQTGDPQLNAILQSSGQTGTINDVSYVKFDIVPTSNILSFNFIFASNEYGQFQCNFSDVFGFILTDLTTNETINIAVIPETNIPISITTIRDNAHNNSCTSVNPQFLALIMLEVLMLV